MLDPIAAAATLAGRRGRVLLHSGRDDDGLGRYSFLAAEPRATLIARGHAIVETDAAGHPIRRYTADPFDAAEAFLRAHDCVADRAFDARAAAPVPRVIGFFGYDLARVVEALPGGPRLGNDTPDLWLGAYDAVARWSPDGAFDVLGTDAGCARLTQALAVARPIGLPPSFGPLVADDDAAHYLARVERVRDYLAAGDVYQVNIARRLVARERMPGDPLALYAALAAVAPAPYGALIEADGATVISGSPERFLATCGDRLETRPIKGTRPLGGADGADALARSPKDGAEHLMIVDLERNDLGRIADTGSVTVDRLGYVV
ncbi:MAG: chorismate-binding protein, partial [Proteobacteria bacterium]|nr:chorismate-binding protein [Pseudomonadota bacterium]